MEENNKKEDEEENGKVKQLSNEDKQGEDLERGRGKKEEGQTVNE